MPLPITAFYAGVLALWTLFLAFKVVGFRRGQKVMLGDGGDEMGERLIRAHGNAIETIPLFLIMLGLAEGLSTPSWLMHLFGLFFTVGRVVHGLHFLKIRKGFQLRFWGMLITVLATALLAVGLIGHAVI